MPAPAHAQALYRRWRPQRFEDVVGQEHITRTLANAVSGGRLAHAYLFTGPRGTGKTSVARILAKAVNCTGTGPKPCNACSICVSMTDGRSLDLIEIDAASNTGVDDVRDLRDKIAFAPNETTYKVYIVDEVHMLSTAAFNALLKTLEEPPPHALFVLATTEPHKIPDTILSRCQRHDFRRVATPTLVAKLARICAAEGIAADEDALAMVARSATGSMRDAESLLDQLMALGEAISLEHVREALGASTDDAVAEVVDALVARDAATALGLINASLDRGADPRQLQGQLLDHLRSLLVIQTGIEDRLLDVTADQLARLRAQAAALPAADLVATIHLIKDARPTADLTHPSLPLELAVVEATLQMADRDREVVEIPAAGSTRPPAGGREAEQTAETASRRPAPRAGDQTAARRLPAAAAGTAQQRSEPRAAVAPGARRSAPGSADRTGPAAPPVTESAVPESPITESRATASPLTESPVTESPVTTSPREESPVTESPVADSPLTQSPVAESPATTSPLTESPVTDSPATASPLTASPASESPVPESPGAALADVLARWSAIVDAVALQDRNTAALLKDCRAVAADGASVTLGFYYEFHCQKVSEARRSATVAAAITRVLGSTRRVICTVVAADPSERAGRPRTLSDQAQDDPLIRHAMASFGARIAGVKRDPDGGTQ